MVWQQHVEEADAMLQGQYREDAVDVNGAASCAGSCSLRDCGLFQNLSFPTLSCTFSAPLTGDAGLGGPGCVSLAPEAVSELAAMEVAPCRGKNQDQQRGLRSPG